MVCCGPSRLLRISPFSFESSVRPNAIWRHPELLSAIFYQPRSILTVCSSGMDDSLKILEGPGATSSYVVTDV